MTLDFSYAGSPARIVFGDSRSSEAADWLRRAGKSRALVLSTPHQQADALALANSLGDLAVGVFSEAAMHTPVEVTERAMKVVTESNADCVVSLGGGSTTGLGKAIAYRTDLLQLVIPTTYAGSEVTNILGETEGGKKTTVRNAKILPEIVIYDPALTLGLPVAMSVTSGLNAMAHAIEGLYAEDRNPISSLMAVEGLKAFVTSLPDVVRDPKSPDARSRALYGAWLCGTVLGAVGMSLHHKICHVLGGSFDMPHAETHAVMLPHTAGFNAAAAREQLAPAAEIFGGSIGSGLWDFAKSLGAPLTLKELGLAEADLDRATEIAVSNPYYNPCPIDRASIRALLQAAWEGSRPSE